MYVLYGQLNGQGEIVKSDIAGLHPAGDGNNCDNCSLIPWTLGHVLFVPSETGASDGDLEEKYVTARYRVMLDGKTFSKVAAHIKEMKAEKRAWNAKGAQVRCAVVVSASGFSGSASRKQAEKRFRRESVVAHGRRFRHPALIQSLTLLSLSTRERGFICRRSD
jgi:hypothetical protein